MHQNIIGNIKVLSKENIENCVEGKTLEGLKGQKVCFVLNFHTILFDMGKYFSNFQIFDTNQIQC